MNTSIFPYELPPKEEGRSKLSKFLLLTSNMYESCRPVGSRVTCNPAPTDTDHVYLVYLKPECWADMTRWLDCNGWDLDGSRIDSWAEIANVDVVFTSYSYRDINLLLTPSAIFNARFLAATSVCKLLNLLDRDHRIAVIQAAVYGNAE